jgi:hypothetical protein
MHLLHALGVLQAFQRLGNRLGLAGQVDDQAVAADHRHLAREDGRGHKGQADLAHLLAKAGHFLVGHGQRGFGRHIAQRRAGAAGGQHQAAAGIHQLDQRLADGGLLVGDQARSKVMGLRAAQPVLQRGQALVLVDAAAGAVADGDNADLHRIGGRRLVHRLIIGVVLGVTAFGASPPVRAPAGTARGRRGPWWAGRQALASASAALALAAASSLRAWRISARSCWVSVAGNWSSQMDRVVAFDQAVAPLLGHLQRSLPLPSRCAARPAPA